MTVVREEPRRFGCPRRAPFDRRSMLLRGERGEGMWYHVGTAATQLYAPEGWF